MLVLLIYYHYFVLPLLLSLGVSQNKYTVAKVQFTKINHDWEKNVRKKCITDTKIMQRFYLVIA